MENFDRKEIESLPNKGEAERGEMWKKALEDDLELGGSLENLPI